MRLDDIKVAYKLFIVVAVGAVAMLVISFTGYSSLKQAGNSLSTMYNREMQGVQDLGKAVEASRIVQSKTLQTMLVHDQEHLQRVIKQTDDSVKTFESSMADFKQEAGGLAVVQESLPAVEKDWNTYKNITAKVREMALAGQTEEALALYESQGSPAMVSLRENMNKLQTSLNDEAAASNAQNDADNDKAIITICLVTLGGLMIQCFISYLNSHSITSALSKMTAACDRLAAGDFRKSERTIHRLDEFGSMADALVAIRDEMNKYMRALNDTALRLNESAVNLRESSLQSAQAATQSAEAVGDSAHLVELEQVSLEDSASAIRKIIESIEEMRGHSNQVTANSNDAAKEAEVGVETIQGSVSQISEAANTVTSSAALVEQLSESSEKIGQIVDTISAIAGQTNLLSLNAAIEAARAGEHGRGFSVVAEEVRKLADESQRAAEEIGTLIKTMQQDINNAVISMRDGKEAVLVGVTSVESLQASFDKIRMLVSEGVEKISVMNDSIQVVGNDAKSISEYVGSVQEQGRRVSDNMQSISAATEEQSASAEEIASASDALSNLADEQHESLEKFKF